MSHRRAVITGLGTVNPLSSDVSQFWSLLCAGQSGIGPISLFDAAPFKVRFGGEVKNFDADGRLGAKVAKRLDRFAQFALAAAINAVADSGIDFSQENVERCGTILGSGTGGMSAFEEENAKYFQQGPGRVSPFLIPKMMANAAPAAVSIHFGLRGQNACFVSACASAADAIAASLDSIRLGRADIILTGGAEAALTPMGLAGFCSAKALSERNESPQQACRPFDRDRDGFVLGEGAGVIVVEEYEHARRRGATIYCELLGAGQSSDSHHITAPRPDGEGACQSIRLALADAGVNAADIQYINTHATSTPLGDAAETKAIKMALGEHHSQLVVSSTKSMIGHLCGGSGGVAAIVCALTLRDGIVHPTINYETPDPACDLDCVPNEARRVPVRRALATSFGFGGHNCCLAFGAV